MLRIRQVTHLAKLLETPPEQLAVIAESASDYCEELILLDPAKPKPREVLCINGELRRIQKLLLTKVLMPKLKPSRFNHGGVKKRHIKTNLAQHKSSRFAITFDIADFYPSIDRVRVYKLFAQRMACSPDVARLLTRVCTYDHHLALGMITSPFLADQIVAGIDGRIAGACSRLGLTYSRYVDDLTISGHFDLESSGIEAMVAKILRDHGFRLNIHKTDAGRLSDGLSITKLRLRNGQPDVERTYLSELKRLLKDAAALGRNEPFEGPYYTRDQLVAKVRHVCWINPRRATELKRLIRAVPWRGVKANALAKGLVATKKRLLSNATQSTGN